MEEEISAHPAISKTPNISATTLAAKDMSGFGLGVCWFMVSTQLCNRTGNRANYTNRTRLESVIPVWQFAVCYLPLTQSVRVASTLSPP